MSFSQLECLRSLDTIFVSTELRQAVIGFEHKVKYLIKAPTGETLFVVTMPSYWFWRICCGSTPIDYILHDMQQQDIFHIFIDDFQCLGKQDLKIVDASTDNVFGTCKFDGGKKVSVKNECGEKILTVKGIWGKINGLESN